MQEKQDNIDMAEICRFCGIIIAMFADDHNPPHFHIRYGDYDATVTISNGIVKGTMPSKALKMVFEWMEDHQEELNENWSRLQNGEEATKIKPLKKVMNDLDLIRITDVDYIKDHTMKLTFSNGEVRIVNFLPLLTKKIHEPLKDLDNFIQFGLNHWTLEWYNGAEFAPDYLYQKGTSVQAA